VERPADWHEYPTGGGNELRISFVTGELQGKFDASGEVCFDLPTLGENYVAATLSGVTDARLLDDNNRRLRTLLAGGPADGEQTLLFSLPVNRASSLVLHGEEGARWRFQWQMRKPPRWPKFSRWIRSARACSG
jgi:hypothetical protein